MRIRIFPRAGREVQNHTKQNGEREVDIWYTESEDYYEYTESEDIYEYTENTEGASQTHSSTSTVSSTLQEEWHRKHPHRQCPFLGRCRTTETLFHSKRRHS